MAKITVSTIISLLILAGSLMAGNIGPDLQSQLATADQNELISVWIRPVLATPKAEMLSVAASDNTTRVGRFQAMRRELERNHSISQTPVMERLQTLKTQGKVGQIKGHWLVNIVETELTREEIEQLASDPNIETIYAAPSISLIEPEEPQVAPSMSTDASTVTNNLIAINADLAWAQGYTGAGRLVCSFDTGVDGDHPALSSSWRGNDGNYAAAWFFPRTDALATPTTIPDCGKSDCNPTHGTHTMGLMVGHDDATGDTVGVAPDAEWISAAVIDIAGVSIIDAFEWAANPDGDFNTVSDVPDVINHSWGVAGIGCENIFYDMIDYTESLGIVNIFSAGNDGAGNTYESIRNPANRAIDSIDCFAVGAVDILTSPLEIWYKSSRGPSDCNGAVKPNVVAPGYLVLSSIPGDRYATLSGTSMAAPQVSGLVALLRQKNPDASVAEIKTAILTSCNQDVSGSPSFPNYDYGWGMIDCLAALSKISSSHTAPSLRVYSFPHDPISPGDTVVGKVVLENLGSRAYDVSINITGSDPSLTVLHGNSYIGTINAGDTVSALNEFRIVVSDTVTIGTLLSLPLTITGISYSETVNLFFQVTPASERWFVTHDVGRIDFSISNYGAMGLAYGSLYPAGGAGFSFDGSDNELYQCGLVIGNGATTVSDGLLNTSGDLDSDFGLVPDGSIGMAEPGANSDQESHCRFDDSRATHPLGVLVEQYSYAWGDYPNDDFIILRYIITNTNKLTTVGGIYVGLFTDWDVVLYNKNSGGWDSTGEFLWTAYKPYDVYSDFRATTVLQGGTATAMTETGDLVSFGDGFTELEKYNSLKNSFVSANTYKTTTNDLIQMIAAQPLNLAPGQSDTVAFAIMAADDLNGMYDVATRARAAYDQIPTDVDDPNDGVLPGSFTLSQNYPNPFNPTTLISFEMAKAGDYELTVYNIAGQVVKQFDGTARIGKVEIEFDGSDLASGVYLYKLTTDTFSASRKMMLLK
ncbi:MAG TPA: S8/S53 family peptidase [candidate division Zixibacteria bacterium]|nr:S8/S53 family peptidase [candidate division Zixibacteria bacterium]